MGARVNASELDIVDLYFKDAEKETNQGVDQAKEMQFYRELSKDLGFPMTVDLIVCNPPWVPADFVKATSPLDNGVYDP